MKTETMIRANVFKRWSGNIIRSDLQQYLLVVLVIGSVVYICQPLSGIHSYHLVSFILLLVISFLATFLRIGPIFLASTLGSLLWNYFFIPPHFTFHIEKTEDNLLFALFFIIAILNGVFTSRVIRQEKITREREERTNALFQLTKQLSKSTGLKEVIIEAQLEIKKYFTIDSCFILHQLDSKLELKGHLNTEEGLSKSDFIIAEWVFINQQKAGRFTQNFSTSDYTFFPLKGAKLQPGILYAKLDKNFIGDKSIEWLTFLTLISNSLEREFLGEIAQKARILDESDKLYKTLFNSISHELRIPIATILGSTDTLMSFNQTSNIHSALYNEIFTATLRLNRLVENLLNMSRLESGRLSVRLDWCDVNDLINKVTDDLKDELKPFKLCVSIQLDIPLVKIDFGLIEQSLFNILFNATQHAPVASKIELIIKHVNNELIIKIQDNGPGFKEEMLKMLLNRYFRINSGKTGGLGLGLSIVKGFIESHKGSLLIENSNEGGAIVTLKIPSANLEINH